MHCFAIPFNSLSLNHFHVYFFFQQSDNSVHIILSIILSHQTTRLLFNFILLLRYLEVLYKYILTIWQPHLIVSKTSFLKWFKSCVRKYFIRKKALMPFTAKIEEQKTNATVCYAHSSSFLGVFPYFVNTSISRKMYYIHFILPHISM